ncbi:MAG: potassium-transporting ATPase subunit F [Candidatus Dormibacteria bacterium]
MDGPPPAAPRSPSLQPFDTAAAEIGTGLTTGLPGSGHGRCDRGFWNRGLRTTGDRHDPRAGTHLMVTHLILLALAVALFIYLGFAMFKPEAF